MKKAALISALLLTAAFCLCAFGCSSDATVKIGVFEPLSGAYSAGGSAEYLGIQYANYLRDTVEIDGVLHKVELVAADNASDETAAADAAQKLAEAGVSVVLGSYGSDLCIAGGSEFDAAGIPAVGISCTSPEVTADNPHYFRVCYIDTFQSTVLANYAAGTLHASAALCIDSGDTYSQGLCDYFATVFTSNGGTVLRCNADADGGFTQALASATDAQVIFAPVSSESAVRLISVCGQGGISVPILGADTWDTADVAQSAAENGVTVCITTFFDEGDTSGYGARFVRGMREWLAKDAERIRQNGGTDSIQAFSALGFDAYMAALEAIGDADSADPADITAALPQISLSGVTGDLEFDASGDAIKNVAFVKRADPDTGRWSFAARQGLG